MMQPEEIIQKTAMLYRSAAQIGINPERLTFRVSGEELMHLQKFLTATMCHRYVQFKPIGRFQLNGIEITE